MTQEALFELDTGPLLEFHVRCPRCGRIIAVETAASDEGTAWNQAILWGYLAQKDHDGQCMKPERSSQ